MQVGTNQLTYNVKDKAGNAAISQVRTVTVMDTQAHHLADWKQHGHLLEARLLILDVMCSMRYLNRDPILLAL